jgi:hypothetical protein
MLLNPNSAAYGPVPVLTVPGAIKVRVVQGMAPAKARAKAGAKHEGPFQDCLGRWHWANGRMMARVDAQGLGLNWPEPVKAPKAAHVGKRAGPFLDVWGRWHHAHGPFMSNAQAIELGLIRVS